MLCLSSLCIGFQINCISQLTASGAPGSTVPVTVPQPTFSGNSGNVLFAYVAGGTNANPVSVTVPASGTSTVNVEVFAFVSATESTACIIPIEVTGHYTQ